MLLQLRFIEVADDSATTLYLRPCASDESSLSIGRVNPKLLVANLAVTKMMQKKAEHGCSSVSTQ